MHHEPELGASAAALDHPPNQERRTPPMKGTRVDFSFSSFFNSEMKRSSVIQMNPKFEKREINDAKMECETEDELDIDVVGSDSETEEDQAISDAQERNLN